MRQRLLRTATVLLVLALLSGCTSSAGHLAAAVAVPPASRFLPAAPIGLADLHVERVAGAELGEAKAVPGATIAAYPPPTGPGALPRGTRPPIIFHGPRGAKQIALTFDSNMTDSMLRRLAAGTVKTYANTAVVDELQRTHTPATFFLAGKWVEAYPQLTRRIAADPEFEVASHSWAHEGFRPGCYGLGTIRPADMAADVERSFQILDRYDPHPTRYFRFPGGCYNAAALAAIAPVGCTAVEYDDVSGDAFGSDPARITAGTVARAKPGSIVVLHITEANAPDTALALPAIIKDLRAKGYRLVTLGTLLA